MTDIFEDAQFVLQRAIDYLNIVLQALQEKIRRNHHRRLNQKSLVRWLAVFFPAPRDPRINVQHLRTQPNSLLPRWGSLASLRSTLSSESLQQLMEEDLGDNFVRFRLDNGDDDGDSIYSGGDLYSGACGTHLTSTPNHKQSFLSSASSTFDPATSIKISEMEEEMASLRKQIAMLVIAQENSVINKTDLNEETINASNPAHHPLPLSPRSLDDSGCESESHNRAISPNLDEQVFQGNIGMAPPPPPPPPPPPLPPPLLSSAFKLTAKSKTPMTKLSVQSMEEKDPFKSRGRATSVPDLCDVLKDLKKVKLRAVERSPGGTPIRRKPLIEPKDPSAIIAQALKKKFAAYRGFSPESDKENDISSSFCSDTNSPFGQHILKKTNRRLSLLTNDNSDSWTPVSSPLKPLNA